MAEEESAPPTVQPDNSVLATDAETFAGHPEDNAERNAYFGDLDVHTTYSFDAFAFSTLIPSTVQGLTDGTIDMKWRSM